MTIHLVKIATPQHSLPSSYFIFSLANSLLSGTLCFIYLPSCFTYFPLEYQLHEGRNHSLFCYLLCSPISGIVLTNNKCSVNICRVNELTSKFIHQVIIREKKPFQVSSHFEIPRFYEFPRISQSFLLLEDR